MTLHREVRPLVLASIVLPLLVLMLVACGRTGEQATLQPQSRQDSARSSLMANAQQHPSVQLAIEALRGSGLRLNWNQARHVSEGELTGMQVPVNGTAALLSMTFRGELLEDASLLRVLADGFPVCHVPPGNDDEEHTLLLSHAALPAHLAHGDRLFPCGGKAEATDVQVVVVDLAGGLVGVFRISEHGELEISNSGTWEGTGTLEAMTTPLPIPSHDCVSCTLATLGDEDVLDPGNGGGGGPGGGDDTGGEGEEPDGGSEGGADPEDGTPGDPDEGGDEGGPGDGDGTGDGSDPGSDGDQEGETCEEETLRAYQDAVDHAQGLVDDAEWSYDSAVHTYDQADEAYEEARAEVEALTTQMNDLEEKQREYESAESDLDDKRAAARATRLAFIVALAGENWKTVSTAAKCVAKFGRCRSDLEEWAFAVGAKATTGAAHRHNKDLVRDAEARAEAARDAWFAVEDDYHPTKEALSVAEQDLAVAEKVRAEADEERDSAFGILEQRRDALTRTQESLEYYKRNNDC